MPPFLQLVGPFPPLSAVAFVRDSLGLVNDIGTLTVAYCLTSFRLFLSLQPKVIIFMVTSLQLCQTWWTVRVKAVQHVVNQYKAMYNRH